MAKHLSPAHAWQRVLKAIAMYGSNYAEPAQKQMYAKWKDCEFAILTVGALQDSGAQFTHAQAFRWAYALCGSFEVTHPQFVYPQCWRTVASAQLQGLVQAIICHQ